ncbi:hypothetical protein pEaSNUABM49_00579 [Erwinia phage pEa_SNUABM_49]|nr:hypothetical protein pEaSNUABM49_00579 [Erwinia phage pEa_SNUABM_49]
MFPSPVLVVYGNTRPPLEPFDRPLQTNYTNTMFLKDNTLYGYGQNNYSQLGLGTTSNVPTFTVCKNGVWKYFLGVHGTLVLGTDLQIYYSGSAVAFPQIGTNTTTWLNVTQYFSAIGVSVYDIADCYIGQCIRILTTSGQYVYCGRNTYGEIGNGSSGSDILSLTIHSTLNGIKKLRCSFVGTHFIDSFNNVLFCGQNSYGEGGVGSTAIITTPTQSRTGVFEIGATYTTTWYYLLSGQIYWSGNNGSGQAGVGSLSPTSSTVPIINNSISFNPVQRFYTQCNTTNANSGSPLYLSNGTIRHCGRNEYGQIGNGNTTTPISSVYTLNLTALGGIDNINTISKDWSKILILTNSGDLWGAGGATGNGTQLPDGNIVRTTLTKMNGMPF